MLRKQPVIELLDEVISKGQEEGPVLILFWCGSRFELDGFILRLSIDEFHIVLLHTRLLEFIVTQTFC